MIDMDLRDRLIEKPELILEDRELMNALISANDRQLGSNVVDLRGLAMDRLEDRLERLEDTHRNVIAAAYENLAGTNQIHRAVLQLLDPVSFDDFLKALSQDIAQTLRVDCTRLVLETAQEDVETVTKKVGEVLHVAAPGFVATYINAHKSAPPRPVTLRQCMPDTGSIYGDKADYVRSEALLILDLGPARLPGMLALGAEDPHLFKASHGTELLTFFQNVFERVMRRWLG